MHLIVDASFKLKKCKPQMLGTKVPHLKNNNLWYLCD